MDANSGSSFLKASFAFSIIRNRSHPRLSLPHVVFPMAAASSTAASATCLRIRSIWKVSVVPDIRGVLLDTGPLVALLDAADHHHRWAAAQFPNFTGKVRICEAVLAEALFLLRALRPGQEKILEWIERGELTCDFVLREEAPAVRALLRRYANVPMSLADACLVRMAEMHPHSVICTIDSDFSLYRRDGRHPLDLLTPSA